MVRRPRPNHDAEPVAAAGRTPSTSSERPAPACVCRSCSSVNWPPCRGRSGSSSSAYLVFLAVYGVLVALREDGPAVRDALMTVVLTTAMCIAFGALALVVGFTLWRGRTALVHTNFFTQDLSKAGPLAPLKVGGVAHALVGTMWMIGIALVLTVPLGLVCAVYLDQTRSRPALFVRSVVQAMTALPTILAGLFIYAFWILILRIPAVGSRRRAGIEHHDAPVPHPDLGPGPAPRAQRPARGVRCPGRASLAHGMARRAAHGALRSRHRGHPGHGAGHRRSLARAPHGGLHDLPQRRSRSRTDGVAAALGLEAGGLRRSHLHRPWIRLRHVPPARHRDVVHRGPGRGRLGPGAPEQASTAPRGTSFGSRRRPGSPAPYGLRPMAEVPDDRADRRPGCVVGWPGPCWVRSSSVWPSSSSGCARPRPTPKAMCRSPEQGPRGRRTRSTSGSATSSSTACGSTTPGTGSTAGRQSFLNGTVDFAASDIPFQTKPDDGSAPETPTPGTYAYMPITAGGTVFMYNLTIAGQRVTNLRLSGAEHRQDLHGCHHQLEQPRHRRGQPRAPAPERAHRPGGAFRRSR